MLKSDSLKYDSLCLCDHHQRTRVMNPLTSYYVGVRLFESINFASKYESRSAKKHYGGEISNIMQSRTDSYHLVLVLPLLMQMNSITMM